MEFVATILFFGLCMAGMAVGVIFSDRELRGSCGGVAIHDADGDALSCGACVRDDQGVCPSDEPLVKLAQIGHPDPKHHRAG